MHEISMQYESNGRNLFNAHHFHSIGGVVLQKHKKKGKITFVERLI